jgi:hypothetical protein
LTESDEVVGFIEFMEFTVTISLTNVNQAQRRSRILQGRINSVVILACPDIAMSRTGQTNRLRFAGAACRR